MYMYSVNHHLVVHYVLKSTFRVEQMTEFVGVKIPFFLDAFMKNFSSIFFCGTGFLWFIFNDQLCT
jgi:hypothetical protein